MATLKARVEGYVGTITDTDSLTAWLRAGIIFIANIIPPDRARKIAQETAFTTSYNVNGGRIIWSTRNGYVVRLVPENIAPLVTESGSIHLARTDDPAGFIRGNALYVYPASGTRYAYVIPYSQDLVYTAESIPTFVEDMTHGVVLFAALRAIIKSISADRTSFNTLVTSVINNPLTVTPNWPTAPDAMAFATTVNMAAEVYHNVTGESSDQAATIDSFGDNPVYTAIDINTEFGNLFSTTGYVNAQLEAEDIELAGAHMDKIKLYLEKYQRDLLNNYNTFQANLAAYQAKVQREIEQAKLFAADWQAFAERDLTVQEKNIMYGLKKEAEQYALNLQRYQAQVQAEGNRIEMLIAAFRANTEATVGTLQALAASFQNTAETYKAVQSAFNDHVKYLSTVTG